MRKNGDSWQEELVVIHNVVEMIAQFSSKPTQIDLSKYRKMYYNIDRLAEHGVEAKITTDAEVFYVSSPILFVQCDDTKPIDIESEVFEEMKKAVVFY